MRQHLCIQIIVLLLVVTGVFAEKPYKQMLSDPLLFTGYEERALDLSGLDHVPIGLFLPDPTTDASAMAVTRGSQLAVESANARGGYRGMPFALVRRWADNPWGAGSSEMVRLVYEDRASSVIGFMNGAGHIAEQIAAKAYLVVISPVSGDPSLTHARLPWIFRLPPDMSVQARSLVEQGIKKRGIKRVIIVSTTDHDGRIAATEFRRELERSGIPPAFHISVEPGEGNIGPAVERLLTFDPDGIVLHLPPVHLELLLEELSRSGIDCPVFIPWIPGLIHDSLKVSYRGPIIAAAPFDVSSGGRFDEFARSYVHRFGSYPPPAAAYGFDAAELLITAIKSGGLTRSGIRKAIVSLKGFQGASGKVEWDNGGGNLSVPLIRMIHGNPDDCGF